MNVEISAKELVVLEWDILLHIFIVANKIILKLAEDEMKNFALDIYLMYFEDECSELLQD